MLVMSHVLGLCGLLLQRLLFADAYRFAGGPVPEKGFVMSRGTARRWSHETSSSEECC